jgi:hypothetical protein
VAGKTLTQARDRVREFVDDPNAVRWTNAQVDVSLQVALSSCLVDYATSGGERFDVEREANTSTVGLLDMSAQTPLVVRGVSVLSGAVYYQLQASSPVRRGRPDNVARAVRVYYVQEYTLTATAGDPMFAGNTWHAFDEWVCAKAARLSLVKDAERRQALDALEVELRSIALHRATSPAGPTTWPRGQDAALLPWWGLLTWQWKPSTSALYLVRRWQ